MKPSEDLYTLVHSLSPAEQRYFKLFSTIYHKKGQHQSLQLFEYLINQPQYDEEDLRAYFHGAAFLKQLSVAKNNLFHLILRSLRTFHRNATPTLSLSESIDKIELLFQMNLLPACVRLLKQAQKRAQNLDLPQKQLELLTWARRLLMRQPVKEVTVALPLLNQTQASILLQVNQEMELRALHDEIFTLINQNMQVQDPLTQQQLDTILAHPLLQLPPETLAFDARIIFHYIHLYKENLLGNATGTLHHFQAMIETWEGCPARIRFETERYLKTLISYIDHSCQATIFLHTEAHLGKLKRMLQRDKKLKAQYSYRVHYLQLRYLMTSGQFLNAKTFAHSLIHQWELSPPPLDQGISLSIAYNLAILFLLLGEYAACLPWLTLIQNHSQDRTREDIRSNTQIITFIVHFELGNWKLLSNLFRSFERKKRPPSPDSTHTEIVVKYLRMLMEALSVREQGIVWGEFKAALLGSAFSDLEVELLSWVESKLGGKVAWEWV